eukprot:g2881.t1
MGICASRPSRYRIDPVDPLKNEAKEKVISEKEESEESETSKLKEEVFTDNVEKGNVSPEETETSTQGNNDKAEATKTTKQSDAVNIDDNVRKDEDEKAEIVEPSTETIDSAQSNEEQDKDIKDAKVAVVEEEVTPQDNESDTSSSRRTSVLTELKPIGSAMSRTSSSTGSRRIRAMTFSFCTNVQDGDEEYDSDSDSSDEEIMEIGEQETPEERRRTIRNKWEKGKKMANIAAAFDVKQRETKVGKKINQYRILQKLGQGGFGKVKLVEDTKNLGTMYAMKEMERVSIKRSRGLSKNASTKEDVIRREIAIMKKLEHPNVAKLIEIIDDSSYKKIYMILKFYEGGPIVDITANDDGVPIVTKTLTLDRSRRAMRDILNGLDYIHFHGIIHRDIKPDNILVDAEGNCVLADFGISDILDGAQRDSNLANIGNGGTPAFMAPEVHAAKPSLATAADFWACGVMLYFFTIGNLPFWKRNVIQLADSIMDDEVKYPETLDPHLKKFLQGLLIKNPSKRFGIGECSANDWITTNGREPLDLSGNKVQIQVTEKDVENAISGVDRLAMIINLKMKMKGKLNRVKSKLAEQNSLKMSNTNSCRKFEDPLTKSDPIYSKSFQVGDGENNDQSGNRRKSFLKKCRPSFSNLYAMESSVADGLAKLVKSGSIDEATDGDKESSDSDDSDDNEDSAFLLSKKASKLMLETSSSANSLLWSQSSQSMSAYRVNRDLNGSKMMSRKSIFDDDDKTIIQVEEDGESDSEDEDDYSDVEAVVTFPDLSGESLEETDGFSQRKGRNRGYSNAWDEICNPISFGPADQERFTPKNDAIANKVLQIAFGKAESDGNRGTMEDRHKIIPIFHGREKDARFNSNAGSLVFSKRESTGKWTQNFAYFGIFDGHSGFHCSEYLSHHLHKEIIRQPAFPSNIPESIQKAFAVTDDAFLNLAATKSYHDGSTGLVAVVGAGKVYIANTGDCRAVLSRLGKAVDITTEHKPSHPEEEKRIEAAGGTVVNGRVMGILGVARSFGDIEYKNWKERCFKGYQLTSDLIIPKPDIKEIKIEPNDEFLVLGSDGIFDSLTSQNVVNILKRQLRVENDLDKAARVLIEEAHNAAVVADNLTVIVIAFAVL